jgi:predicted nucleotide-binding protein
LTSANDLFGQINNAVLDLQAAQLQTYERPLKRLGKLLRHPDLEEANAALTTTVDLDRFLLDSEKTQEGGMGSARLLWPDSLEQTLGLTLLLVQRFADDPDLISSIAYQYYYQGGKTLTGIQAVVGQMIIPFARDYKAFVLARGVTAMKVEPPLTNRIFIVHGHEDGARETLARFLERLGFEAIILHEQPNKGRTIIEKVEANSDVSFAVVLLTPDDEGRVNGGTLEPRARQNVLLELGYFIGRLGRERVCALKRGALEIPSDFAGVIWEAMDQDGGWKLRLARELEAAGHTIDWNKVMR